MCLCDGKIRGMQVVVSGKVYKKPLSYNADFPRVNLSQVVLIIFMPLNAYLPAYFYEINILILKHSLNFKMFHILLTPRSIGWYIVNLEEPNEKYN